MEKEEDVGRSVRNTSHSQGHKNAQSSQGYPQMVWVERGCRSATTLNHKFINPSSPRAADSARWALGFALELGASPKGFDPTSRTRTPPWHASAL